MMTPMSPGLRAAIGNRAINVYIARFPYYVKKNLDISLKSDYTTASTKSDI